MAACVSGLLWILFCSLTGRQLQNGIHTVRWRGLPEHREARAIARSRSIGGGLLPHVRVRWRVARYVQLHSKLGGNIYVES